MGSFLNTIANSFSNNLIVEQRYQMILEGLQTTLFITFSAAILGTLLGGLVCWARMSRRPWLRRTAILYIDLMRGTPVLVFLMLMYYVFMSPLKATGVTVAIVTFAMNSSAYIGEILRTTIEGIDKGQSEAGLALGYTPGQVFVRIILPQVVRKIMPVYIGEIISLLKGTSIVGYIAVVDMTRASDLIRSRTFDAFFPLILTAAIYFLIAWLIGMLLNGIVEKRRTRSLTAAVILLLLWSLGSIPTVMKHYEDKTMTETVPPIFRQLEGKSVGVVVGSIQDITMTRYAPKANIKRLTTLTDLLASLENGKVDYVCEETTVVVANPQIAEAVDTIDAGLPPMPISACFRLGNTELQEDFNNYLTDIRADGTYQTIHDRWFAHTDASSIPVPRQKGTGSKLTIATFPGMLPYNFICHGEPSGFEIDLLTEWANRRKYRLEYLVMDFASQIPAVQTGKADMAIGGIYMTEERQKKVLFSEEYFESRIMFYTRKGEGYKLIIND